VRLVHDRADGGGATVDARVDDSGVEWSITNDRTEPLAVRAARVVWRAVDVTPPVRIFRHGYQSWSHSGWATLGVDDDPSRAKDAIPLVVDMHHADPSPAAPGELRSELVTVLADGSDDPPIVLGFLDGARHDGTFRLRDVDGTVELAAEAHLGGAVLAPGEHRGLHGVAVVDDLDTWARRVGGRASAPYQVGWCSWYHYFHGVTERDVLANLALADRWPFEVFQLDDGYQAAIGDWLATNDRFPSPLADLAARIDGAGRVPGIWLAPFLVAPSSAVATAHPEWLAGHRSGRSLIGMINDEWGGLVYTLDTTRADVCEHLTAVAAALVDAGFRYLKLDFTYAPALDGAFADPGCTPAERTRAGFDAIRRGAGDDVFLLGCGAPLGATIGVVDGMRIGPDVAPWWDVPDDQPHLPGYDETRPSTANALAAVEARQFFHRRQWLNDPDCLMLRTRQTRMTADEVRRWATAVAESGGMALVSDDLSLLDADARALLDEVVSIGRARDAATVARG